MENEREETKLESGKNGRWLLERWPTAGIIFLLYLVLFCEELDKAHFMNRTEST